MPITLLTLTNEDIALMHSLVFALLENLGEIVCKVSVDGIKAQNDHVQASMNQSTMELIQSIGKIRWAGMNFGLQPAMRLQELKALIEHIYRHALVIGQGLVSDMTVCLSQMEQIMAHIKDIEKREMLAQRCPSYMLQL